MYVCGECGATQPAPGACRADGSPLAPIGDEVLLGTMIGPYRIARLMGIGGMGRVYKAVHPSIGSRVAVKVLSRECADRRELVERFFAEAKTVNLIKHEAIVNVLDLAMLPDGRPYIVMEYLDGSSLAAIIEDARRSGRPLPIGGIARLVGEVLGGLGAAHAKGVIHRDLKPDNIYVTPQGRAKVLDFGIAKLQPEFGGSSTQTGSLLGTPHYMSPEQAAGRPVDTRADIYAIGVILFECTTLQRPFNASALFDMLKMHIEQPPPPPRSLRADIPDGLEAVILTAMAKPPDHRFATAQAMSAALQHATSSLPSDQWTTLVPSTRGASAPTAWAPTPPASWAGGSSHTKVPKQANDTEPSAFESTQLPEAYDTVPVPPSARTETPSTQPSGPVAHTQPRRSRKGLWLGLVGIALAGGGVAAGVILAGGGNKPTQTATPGSGSGSGSGSATVEVVVAAADAALTEPVPVAPPGKHEMTPEQIAEMDELVEQVLPLAPVEALPGPMRDAIKKYGSWKNVPRAEKNKILAAGPDMFGDVLAGITGAGAGINDMLSGGFDDPPPNPKNANGWLDKQSDLPLQGFEPKQLNVHVLLAWSIEEAKKLYPDAALFGLSAYNVNANAFVDATVVPGYVETRFLVPSRKAGQCAFRITVDGTGAHVGPDIITKDCTKETVRGAPKCSVLEIWQHAIKAGAASDQRATIAFYRGAWAFQIGKHPSTLADDCK